jgi:hypothetical protein
MYQPSTSTVIQDQHAKHLLYQSLYGDREMPSDTLKLGDKTYRNMTSHPVIVYSRSGELVARFESCSSYPPRVRNYYAYIDSYLSKAHFEHMEDLPPEDPDLYLIVSYPVKVVCPDRSDLVTPGGQVRDSNGRVIGCTGFIL